MDGMDDALRLALVDQLIRNGVLPAFDRATFIRERGLARDYPDNDELDYQFVFEIQFQLLSWLQPSHLPLLEELYWAGGMQTQHWIWNYWDGESDEFDVASL